MSRKLIITCLMSDGSKRNLTVQNSKTASDLSASLVSAACAPLIATNGCYISVSEGNHVTDVVSSRVETTTSEDVA